MTRKKLQGRIPVSDPASRVESVPVEGLRVLMTLAPDIVREADEAGAPIDVEGAFVRLVGPRAECEEVRDYLIREGAVAVKVEATPEHAAPLAPADQVKPNDKVRDVAMRLVDASRFPRKDELRAKVDRCLAKAGL